MVFGTNTVIFWTNTVVFGTNTVVFLSNAFKFGTNTVIFGTNTVLFWKNKVLFVTNTVLFWANTVVFETNTFQILWSVINRSSHLGIHKQTNACWSIPRSQTVFYHFKICIKWEL